MNSYKGKYFSILGDSISTVIDYIPLGYDSFYKYEICEYSGVKEPKDTWWGQVLKDIGGKLLINNSWSGSLVVKRPDCRKEFHACGDDRTSKLGKDGISPDVIMVYMCTNDWFNDVDIEGDIGDLSCFRYAYTVMLEKIKRNYPNAEIWCFTLIRQQYDLDNPNFELPKTDGKPIEEYCKVIRECAESKQCGVIELYDNIEYYGTITYSNFTEIIHPNAEGMKRISSVVLKQLES